MALSNYSAFYNALQKQNSVNATITGGSGANTRLHDLYRGVIDPTTGAVPAIPSTASALSKSNTTALNYYLPNYSPELPYIVGARSSTQGVIGYYLIIDRLSHQGGLDGNSALTQTTNLPTAALTRFTSGVGVMIGLTIYTAVGTAGSTITASYTNQAGTSGRTTVAQVFGITANNTAGRLLILPLAAGDTGARSVESVTLASGSGTSGNFGVTLFKILGAIALDTTNNSFTNDMITGGLLGGIPELQDASHISLLGAFNNTTSSGNATLLIAEG
jgi:hypothetical protein